MPLSEPEMSKRPNTFAVDENPHDAVGAGTIFQGPLGLRAGWGIALNIALTLLLATLFFIAIFNATGQMKRVMQERRQAHQVESTAQASHQTSPVHLLPLTDAGLTELSEAAAVLVAGVLMAKLEKRRFGVYGLTTSRLKDFLPGALVGVLAISLLVGSLAAFHLLVFDGRLLHGSAVLRYGFAWLLVCFMVGLFEEFLFRGYLQFTLMRGLLRLGARLSPDHAQRAAFWLSALVWSVSFSAVHLSNAGEDPMGLVSVFGAGVVFSYALWRTGSLWWGIGFHMTWDWGQSFLWGVPDSGQLSVGRLFATHPVGSSLLSGGSAGPEGSVLILPVLLLIALAIRMHPQIAPPPVEPASLPRPQGHLASTLVP